MMKCSILFFCALLATAANAFADGDAPPVDATATSNTAVSANRSGASATSGSAATTSANTQHAQADFAGSSEMNATLSKSIDTRKAKPGDPVTATTDKDAKSADGTRIKRGSKLVGHVTRAQPLDKSAAGSAGAASMLSVVFDKAILKDGREVPLNATIQAVSAAQSDASMASDLGGAGVSAVGSGAGSARAAGGGLLGAAGGSVAGGLGAAGGMTSSTARSAHAVGGLNGGGMLATGSQGVFGINGLEFASSSAAGAEGSVITSSTRNVSLDGGTQMLLADSGDSTMAFTRTGATEDSSDSSSAEKIRRSDDNK